MDSTDTNGICAGSAAPLQGAGAHRPLAGILESLQEALRDDWASFQQGVEASLQRQAQLQEVRMRRQERRIIELLAERPLQTAGGSGLWTRLRSGGDRCGTGADAPAAAPWSQASFEGLVPSEGAAVEQRAAAASAKAARAPAAAPAGLRSSAQASPPAAAPGLCGVPAPCSWLRCLRSEESRPSEALAATLRARAPAPALELVHEEPAAGTPAAGTPAATPSASPEAGQQMTGGDSCLSSAARQLRGDSSHGQRRMSNGSADATESQIAMNMKGDGATTPLPLRIKQMRQNSGLEGGSGRSRGERPDNTSPSKSMVHFHLKMEHGSRVRRTMYALFSSWIDWWMNLVEPERNSWLYRRVSGTFFSTVCALVILMNGVVVAWAANDEIKEPRAPGASTWQGQAELVFLLFYVLELSLKLLVHGLFYFCNNDWMWNMFDCALVTVSILSCVFEAGSSNVSFVRSLRIFKMAKVLRMVRVMRFFAELRLILNSLLGSFVSLFWSIVMLMLIMYIFGLLYVQETASYFVRMGEDIDPVLEENLREYFGSVQLAMLSLYMTATGGDDWSVFFNIIRVTGTLASCLWLFFVAFIHIAVLNVLTGIFVENAMRLAVPDRDTLALEHRKREIAEADELRRICKELDHDQSGTIDMDEFKELVGSGKVRAHLSLLGLHIKDAELFLNMLAASSEGQEVDIESIVQGCMRMKGSASSLDVQNLIFITKIIHKRQKRFEKEVRRTLSQLQDRTAAVIDGLGLEVDADDAADGEASDHPIGHWQGSETPRSPRSRATSKISAGAAEPQR